MRFQGVFLGLWEVLISCRIIGGCLGASDLLLGLIFAAPLAKCRSWFSWPLYSFALLVLFVPGAGAGGVGASTGFCGAGTILGRASAGRSLSPPFRSMPSLKFVLFSSSLIWCLLDLRVGSLYLVHHSLGKYKSPLPHKELWGWNC